MYKEVICIMKSEFKSLIEERFNTCVNAYIDGDTSKDNLEIISLCYSILNSMSNIDKNTQMVEVEKQLEESMKNFDPSVLEGFLANFGNLNK